MSRSTAVLLGAVVVLAGLVVLFANPFSSREGGAPAETPLFAGATAGAADRIEIRTALAAPVTLERRGQDWVVSTQGGFPADTAAVGSILRAVENARSSEVVSGNPANRGKFQVDSTGVEVRVSSGTRDLARFVVGKGGQDFTTSYVRAADSDQVRAVRGLNRNLFLRPRGFRDLTLFRFDPAQVSAVSLGVRDGGWSLARGDTAWTLTAPGTPAAEARREVVEQLLGTLAKLSADGIEDRPDTLMTGLDRPDTVLTVTLAGGSLQTLDLGRGNARGQRYASVPGRGAVYLLGDWRVNAFAKKADELTGMTAE